MPVTFSLLIYSFVFGSLAFNCSAKLNRSQTLFGEPEVNMLFSAKPYTVSNESENPAPHRGSGRMDLSQSLKNPFHIG
jgi:hypothetical protein